MKRDVWALELAKRWRRKMWGQFNIVRGKYVAKRVVKNNTLKNEILTEQKKMG